MAMRGVLGEFKLLLAEVGDVAKLKQKAARAFGPTLAAISLGTGGLYYHKHFHDFTGSARLDPHFEQHASITLPQASAEKIRTAALRGCPVEQDCIDAVRGREDLGPCTMDSLVELWENAGYFCDAPSRDEIGELFLDPQVVSSYGKDIYSVTATQNAFGKNAFSTWSEESVHDGLHLLSTQGYCVVNSVVAHDLIRNIRSTLEIPSFDAASSFEVRHYAGVPAECEMIKPSPGRRHFLVRKTEYEEVLASLFTGVSPLIQAYLSKHRTSKKPYLSELQVVVTEPLAVQQFWHRDNVTPGLTVVVPLTDVPPNIGHTALLPTSHELSPHNVSGEQSETLHVGDVLIYDSRLLHRGKRNATYNKTRIMVVCRFDFEPPPGQGVVLTAVNAIYGNVLHAIGRIHKNLP